MYRCFRCGEVVPPKTACKKVVIASRVKYYPERLADLRKGIVVHRPLAYIDERGKRRLRYPSDPGGKGYETEREVSCCPHCAAKYEKERQQWQS